VSWSLNDDLELIYGDPIAIWKDWADNVGGCGIESGATSPKKIQLLSQPRSRPFSDERSETHRRADVGVAIQHPDR